MSVLLKIIPKISGIYIYIYIYIILVCYQYYVKLRLVTHYMLGKESKPSQLNLHNTKKR